MKVLQSKGFHIPAQSLVLCWPLVILCLLHCCREFLSESGQPERALGVITSCDQEGEPWVWGAYSLSPGQTVALALLVNSKLLWENKTGHLCSPAPLPQKGELSYCLPQAGIQEAWKKMWKYWKLVWYQVSEDPSVFHKWVIFLPKCFEATQLQSRIPSYLILITLCVCISIALATVCTILIGKKYAYQEAYPYEIRRLKNSLLRNHRSNF